MTGIYKITNKITQEAYIGQSLNIEKRFEQHIMGKPSLIHRMIEKYGVTNFQFEILEECSKEKLDEREIFWIAHYDTFNNGYNLTKGGNTGFSYDYDKIYADYLLSNSAAKTARNIGCGLTTVYNALKCFGVEVSAMQESKAIEQIDPTTLEVVQTFNSLAEAAEYHGVDVSAISMALTGHHLSSAGYYWREKGSNKTFEMKAVKAFKKSVIQYDMKNNYITSFESAADAARSLGKDGKNGGSQIGAVCRGKKKSAYGYKWKYSE